MKRATTAKDVMRTDVLTVPIDLTAGELADFFAGHQITGAPVAGLDGKLVGVVTLMDLAENHARRGNEDLLVGDIMTPAVYSVREETPIPEVARTMLTGRIHRLFVTRRGTVVGIVTTMDLLELLCQGRTAPGAAIASTRKAARPAL